PGDTIRTHLVFAKEPPEATSQMVNLAVLGWAWENGYARPTPTTIIGDSDWKAAVRLTNDARGLYGEKDDEDSVGDEAVRVYPVRTALCRLQSSEADCVVSFPRPYDKDTTGTLDEKTKDRVKELVAGLKLKERKRVEFCIRMKRDRNRKAVE